MAKHFFPKNFGPGLPFRPLGDDEISRSIMVRPTPDGGMEGYRTEQVSHIHRANKEEREARSEQGQLRGTGLPGPGDLHEVARLSQSEAQEMDEVCGNDPDMRGSWLRDHPQCLTVRPSAAELPRLRIICYPKRNRGRR